MDGNGYQSAIDVVSKPVNALGVSAGGILTATGNWFEIVQPIIGGVAGLLSIWLVVAVIRDYRQKRVFRALEIRAMRRAAKFTVDREEG